MSVRTFLFNLAAAPINGSRNFVIRSTKDAIYWPQMTPLKSPRRHLFGEQVEAKSALMSGSAHFARRVPSWPSFAPSASFKSFCRRAGTLNPPAPSKNCACGNDPTTCGPLRGPPPKSPGGIHDDPRMSTSFGPTPFAGLSHERSSISVPAATKKVAAEIAVSCRFLPVVVKRRYFVLHRILRPHSADARRIGRSRQRVEEGLRSARSFHSGISSDFSSSSTSVSTSTFFQVHGRLVRFSHRFLSRPT